MVQMMRLRLRRAPASVEQTSRSEIEQTCAKKKSNLAVEYVGSEPLLGSISACLP